MASENEFPFLSPTISRKVPENNSKIKIASSTVINIDRPGVYVEAIIPIKRPWRQRLFIDPTPIQVTVVDGQPQKIRGKEDRQHTVIIYQRSTNLRIASATGYKEIMGERKAEQEQAEKNNIDKIN